MIDTKKYTITRMLDMEDDAWELAYKWTQHGFYEKVGNKMVCSSYIGIVEFKEIK